MCGKCTGFGGILFLVFGLIFLLKDLNVWNFWNISWFTVAFILYGFWHMGSSGCRECHPELKKKK